MIKHDVEEKTNLTRPALQKLAMDTLTHGTVSQLRHAVLTDLAPNYRRRRARSYSLHSQWQTFSGADARHEAQLPA